MILAGDVGGTKCNIALFAENGGKLHVVFRQRFASKDFAKFDLIIREFTRQAAPHLTDEKVRISRNVHPHHEVYAGLAPLRSHVDLPKFERRHLMQEIFQ